MDTARLMQHAFAGRAILLAGQDIQPGTTEHLRTALISSFQLGTETTFAAACAAVSDAARMIGAIESAEELSPEVRRITEVPWAAVFTSAFDDRLSSELAIQDSNGRRLRHQCVDEDMPAFFPRRSDVVTVLHLSHRADERTATGLPLCGRDWGKAQRLFIPGVLRDLPQAVGPAHLLCIAGFGPNDPISPTLIADCTNELDPDNVYWFVSPNDGIDIEELRQLAPGIHFIDSDFPTALASYISSSGQQIAASKQQLLELSDLTVSVTSPHGPRVLTFRASELREFRRHLVIMPDMSLMTASVDRAKRKREFIAFLSKGRETPDWSGISEGYALQRDAYSTLLALVLARVNVISGAVPRGNPRRGGEGAPIFLAGPPASGRTVGLLWLGYELRKKGVFVVQLLPSGGTIDSGAVEQILRLLEARGAAVVVVLLDRTDRRVAENLDRHLRSAGRRALVVASVAPKMGRRPASAENDLDDEEVVQGTEISLSYGLSDAEVTRFRAYLSDNYGTAESDPIIRLLEKDPSLFAVLYRLIPDTRENIREVIVEEYLDLVEDLTSFQPPENEPVRGSTLRDQLQKWVGEKKLRQSADTYEQKPLRPGPWNNIATKLPQLVLLFSSLDEAVSLNLLTKRFPGLLQAYRPLAAILESSGLFLEVELDRQKDIGLTAVNPFVASLLLTAALPYSVSRIELLFSLLNEFPWDPDSRPIDSPEQSLLIHVLRSISPPSGSFQSEYQRTEDLKALAAGLRHLRQQVGVSMPQLLLLEGITLRHLGRRLGVDGRANDALEAYHLSRTVLEHARDVLVRRRPSPGRNFEISMVLTAISATIGHTFNAESRAVRVDEAKCKELVQSALETASESRAYTDAYHPLDTAFWTNRDFYNYLAELPETDGNNSELQKTLLSMADALDKAAELGQLPSDQAGRFGERLVQLETYLQNAERAQQIADDEASQGRFSGACLVARLKAISSRSNQIIGPAEARAALGYLEGYAPKILTDDRALTLMHRLWVGAHLGNKQLDSGPYSIACSATEWQELERIVAARRITAGNTRVPYVNFWLAVALAQQGDIRRSLQILEEVQANSLAFSHRRLTPLIYLSEDLGSPKIFGSIVRRREDDDLLAVFVPTLGIEIRVSKRYQGSEAMNVQRGDEIKVLVALNYWTPMGVLPSWEDTRSKRSNESAMPAR